MKVAFTPMPVPDQLSPATTPLRKLPSCNHEIVFISPSDTEPVDRVASLTFLPCDEKAFQLGRRFGSRLGEETLCESLFWESEGTSKEAEIETPEWQSYLLARLIGSSSFLAGRNALPVGLHATASGRVRSTGP
jgi:hypothetical protein